MQFCSSSLFGVHVYQCLWYVLPLSGNYPTTLSAKTGEVSLQSGRVRPAFDHGRGWIRCNDVQRIKPMHHCNICNRFIQVAFKAAGFLKAPSGLEREVLGQKSINEVSWLLDASC